MGSQCHLLWLSLLASRRRPSSRVSTSAPSSPTRASPRPPLWPITPRPAPPSSPRMDGPPPSRGGQWEARVRRSREIIIMAAEAGLMERMGGENGLDVVHGCRGDVDCEPSG
ncbi:hypothetical protein PVAP13_5NG252762 [Panicum virgatum]|uniref:Uncharacterized protein n=1 Tax=Panicum virgatum TaxID=38727 RepID=A0A8T0RWN6_PANVG|nr:hypothetical protein PVAP13_5NG252762 [Panicum virgatum]